MKVHWKTYYAIINLIKELWMLTMLKYILLSIVRTLRSFSNVHNPHTTFITKCIVHVYISKQYGFIWLQTVKSQIIIFYFLNVLEADVKFHIFQRRNMLFSSFVLFFFRICLFSVHMCTVILLLNMMSRLGKSLQFSIKTWVVSSGIFISLALSISIMSFTKVIVSNARLIIMFPW